MIWITLVALTLSVLALLAVPLLRPRAGLTDRAEYDLTVYRDQLKEVDADVERGLLSAQQAEAARTEIKRRMLAAADKPEVAAVAGGSYTGLVVVLALLVPALALALYAVLGHPELPDQPFAERQDTRQDPQMADIAGLLDKLAERLKQTPEDVEGWAMLARSARAMERHDYAAEAFARLVALGQKDAAIYAGLGESLLFRDQAVTPQAVAAFQDALRLDPRDVRSRFYLGMARMETGDAEGAIAIWKEMEATAPADAEWLAGVRARITEAAATAGLDPAKIAPKAPELGPASAAPPADAAGTQAMITAMVDRLAAKLKDNPDDAEGWKRLGRAYRVQQKLDLAKDAYGKAIALLPRDVELRMAYADVLLAQVAEPAKALPPEFVQTITEVLQLDPSHGEALFYAGIAAAQSGQLAEARALWLRLRDSLPEGSPERAAVQKQIDGLGG